MWTHVRRYEDSCGLIWGNIGKEKQAERSEETQ